MSPVDASQASVDERALISPTMTERTGLTPGTYAGKLEP